MGIDVSTGVSELFSGKKRTRLLPTLAIAALVTGVVAIPLAGRAVDNRDNPAEAVTILVPADAQSILVDTAESDPVPLDLSTIAGPVLISLNDQQADAVSFRLFAAGADQALVESRDSAGPQFDLVVSESGGGAVLDTTKLQDGAYELFVTIRESDEDRRTAVSFRVQNS